jgi:tetratricopeptide (TPR) repeat protein
VTELSRIDALIDLGRYDEAVTALRRLLATDGAAAADADAWCRLSLANLRLDRDADALDAAGRAAALTPDNDWPHRLASHALESLGRHDEAVRAAGEAVRLAPYTWQGHARFAATLSASGGDLRLARQAAGYAVELAPNEPDAHSAMGLVALRQGDHDTAERAFKHVLSLQPDHHSALNNLAVVQLRRRDLDGALNGFSAAIRSEPQQEVARRNVDVVVRAVLYRAQWFVFLAAYGTRWIVSRHDAHQVQVAMGRPERLVVVAVIGAFAVAGGVWSLRRIPPPLRPYARSVVRRSRLLLLSASVSVCAFLTVLAVVVPARATTAAGVSAVAALLGVLGVLLSMANRQGGLRWRNPFRRG